MSGKAYYKQLKDRKVCVRCRKQDERTLQGLSMCEDCRQAFNKYWREYVNRPERRTFQREAAKNSRYKQYYNRRENHQCTVCGTVLEDDYFFTQCPKCRRYKSEYNKKKKTAGAATPNGQKKIS